MEPRLAIRPSKRTNIVDTNANVTIGDFARFYSYSEPGEGRVACEPGDVYFNIMSGKSAVYARDSSSWRGWNIDVAPFHSCLIRHPTLWDRVLWYPSLDNRGLGWYTVDEICDDLTLDRAQPGAHTIARIIDEEKTALLASRNRTEIIPSPSTSTPPSRSISPATKAASSSVTIPVPVSSQKRKVSDTAPALLSSVIGVNNVPEPEQKRRRKEVRASTQ
ncbi:hypothetical protein PLICRDRAFT_702512 [Plicaturopsis crispa FD-325 SS-3]|uniref:Uncharacterized protein n=1 Tax=Plicaturopsis crispa FD-325 SS-3 TaxID=944288 RepID=A0A0C9SVZ3_PLICR|nr:hypothetical protein PLICRDRAFT_702512 [Plicaturopsis crispa FD-325 SS-3]